MHSSSRVRCSTKTQVQWAGECHVPFSKCQESAKIWPKISSYEANIAELSRKMRLGSWRFLGGRICVLIGPFGIFLPGWELEVLLKKDGGISKA